MQVMNGQQQEGDGIGRRRKYGTIASRVEEVRQEVREEQHRSVRYQQRSSNASSNESTKKVSPRQQLNAIESTSRSKPPKSPNKLPSMGGGTGRRSGPLSKNGINGYHSDRSNSELSNGSSEDSTREANRDVTVPTAASWIDKNGSDGSVSTVHQVTSSQRYQSTSEKQQHEYSVQTNGSYYSDSTEEEKQQHEYSAQNNGSYYSDGKDEDGYKQPQSYSQEPTKNSASPRQASVSDGSQGQLRDSDPERDGKYDSYQRPIEKRPNSAEAVADAKENREADGKEDDDSSSYNSEAYVVNSPEKLYTGSAVDLMEKVGDSSSGSAVKAAIQTLAMMERLMEHNKHEYPEFTSALNKASTLRGLLGSNPNSTQLRKEFISSVDKAYDLSQQVELSPNKSMKTIRLDPKELKERMDKAEEEEPEEQVLDLESLRGRLERLLTAAENISMFFDPKYIIVDDTVKQRLSALRAAKETFSKFLQERKQRQPEYEYSQKDVQHYIDAAYACIHDHLIEVSRKWYRHYDAAGIEEGIGPRGLLQMVKTVADHSYNLEKRSKLIISLERCYGKTGEGQLKTLMSSGREKLESQELYTALSGYIDSTLSLLAELESHSGRSFKFTDSNQAGLFKAAWREFHNCVNGLGSASLAALNLGSANTQTGQKTQIRSFQQALTSLERKYSTALQVLQECLRRKYEEEARRKRAEELVDEEANLRGRLKRQERQVDHILQKARAAREREQMEAGTPKSASENSDAEPRVNATSAKEIEDMCFDILSDVNEGWRLGNLVRFQLPEDTEADTGSETYVPLPPDLSTQPREAMDLERLQDFASHIQNLAGRIFDLQQAWQKALMTAEREAEERKREPPAMERVVCHQSSLPSDPSFRIQPQPQPAEGDQSDANDKPRELPKPSLVESQKKRSDSKTGARRFTLPIAEECKGHRSLAVVLIDQPRLRSLKNYPRSVNALTDYSPTLGQAISLDYFDNASATILQLDTNRISARLRALLDIYRNILNFTKVIYKSSKKSVKRSTLVRALSKSTNALKEADANVPGLFHTHSTSYGSVESIRLFESYVRRAEMEVISLIMAYEVIIGARSTPISKRSPRRARSEGGNLRHLSGTASENGDRHFFPEPLQSRDRSASEAKLSSTGSTPQGKRSRNGSTPEEKRSQNGTAQEEKVISPRSENEFRDAAKESAGIREPYRPSHGGIRNQNSSPRVRATLTPRDAQENGELNGDGHRGNYPPSKSSPRVPYSGQGEGRSPRNAGAPSPREAQDKSELNGEGHRGNYPPSKSSPRVPSSGQNEGRSPRNAEHGSLRSVGSRRSHGSSAKRSASQDRGEEQEPDPSKTKKGVQWQKDDGSKWGSRHKGITIDKNDLDQSPRSQRNGGRKASNRSHSESSRTQRDPMLLKEEAGWHDVESFNQSKGIHHVSSRHNMPINKKK